MLQLHSRWAVPVNIQVSSVPIHQIAQFFQQSFSEGVEEEGRVSRNLVFAKVNPTDEFHNRE
jgi:hypothetical protein